MEVPTVQTLAPRRSFLPLILRSTLVGRPNGVTPLSVPLTAIAKFSGCLRTQL